MVAFGNEPARSIQHPPVLTCTRTQYLDSRPGFPDQNVIELVLPQTSGGSVEPGVNMPDAVRVVLFLNSNNKAMSREYERTEERPTQDEDLRAVGFTFARDVHAIMVYQALIKKAGDLGLDFSQEPSSWPTKQPDIIAKLTDPEVEVLTMLRTGLVRSRNYLYSVNSKGAIERFGGEINSPGSGIWALGSAVPAA